MREDRIACRPVAELRRAAAAGQAYYNCERFEDAYGRLVVGIGARLEGKALRYVATCGRKAVFASPIEVPEGPSLHAAVRKATRKESERGKDSLRRRKGDHPEGWGSAVVPTRKAIGQAMQALSRICPDAVGLVAQLDPLPGDLAHGVQVALYARNLLTWAEGAGDTASSPSARCPSARAEQTTFLAGLLHDIGRWRGATSAGHSEAGASTVREMAERWPRLSRVAETVAHHHDALSSLPRKGWEARRAAAVVLAETVVESRGSPDEAVYRTALEGVPEDISAVLVGLCNLEKIVPARAIVQMNAGPNGEGEGRESAEAELAVSLCVPDDDPFRPYLLRFARRDHRGHLVPLVDLDGEGVDPVHLLSAGGQTDHRLGERCIVGLLAESSYRSRFARYEALLPSFRSRLEHRSACTAQDPEGRSGTKRAQQCQPEPNGVAPLRP